MDTGLLLLLLCGIAIVVALILFMPLRRSATRTNLPAGRRPSSPIYRDDDRYWYAGLFYYNPDDPDAFVPKRYGLGWTVNFAHPMGKLFIAVIVLMGLVIPLVVAFIGVLSPGLLHPIGCHPSGCYPFP